jgi:hypothetical protein
MESHLTDISRVIQLAVAPVFLLTAIATLINTLNGRLGRIVDRRRTLFGRAADGETVAAELDLLERRSRLVYFAIFSSRAFNVGSASPSISISMSLPTRTPRTPSKPSFWLPHGSVATPR